MFKPIAFGVALATIAATFNVHAQQERGPYPTLFPGGRFTPHELKYFEELERKRAAEKATSDDRASSGQVAGVERGPYPTLFPGGRFTPHELKYFESQERARKANSPTGAPGPVFPSSVVGP